MEIIGILFGVVGVLLALIMIAFLMFVLVVLVRDGLRYIGGDDQAFKNWAAHMKDKE